MRVLVVDDHEVLAETVATGLRREGIAVDIAYDGRDALAHARLTPYEVIVLDRDLPEMHGDEVCRALVADSFQGRVLMLTAAGTVSVPMTISPSRLTSASSSPASGRSPAAAAHRYRRLLSTAI